MLKGKKLNKGGVQRYNISRPERNLNFPRGVNERGEKNRRAP